MTKMPLISVEGLIRIRYERFFAGRQQENASHNDLILLTFRW